MPQVFVDTAAWIALLNTSDALRAPAQAVLAQLRAQSTRLITSEFVLLELANALSAPALRRSTIAFIESLPTLDEVEIIALDTNLLAAGWELYRARPDKEWGLTDCVSFVIMRQAEITVAFTSDHHFEQAGFTKLL